MPEELLPPPAQVRCHMAIDLHVQLTGLMAVFPEARVDPRKFVDVYVARRDSILIDRLQSVIPEEELKRAVQNNSIDMDALIQRVPSAHAMWVMITALVAQQAATDLASLTARST